MARVSRNTSMRTGFMAVLALSMTCVGWAQQALTPPSPAATLTSQEPAAKDDNRTEKQRMLAHEAQLLVAMAAELKVEVDKTNKNILSLNVVRKAEQIEALAHRMKDQGKK